MSETIKQFRFYCPTCDAYSYIADTDHHAVLGRLFGTVTDPQKPNYCSHENAELESRELQGVGEWIKLTTTDAPRANPGR